MFFQIVTNGISAQESDPLPQSASPPEPMSPVRGKPGARTLLGRDEVSPQSPMHGKARAVGALPLMDNAKRVESFVKMT